MGKRGQRQRGKRGPTVLVLLVIGWNCLCENFGEEYLQLATCNLVFRVATASNENEIFCCCGMLKTCGFILRKLPMI